MTMTLADGRQVLAAQCSEAALQAAITELAKACGWRVYHTHDSRRSEPGFPDLVLERRRRMIFAELKTERGRLSATQREWLDALRSVPGIQVRLWRPSDWQSGRIETELRG